MKKHLFILLLCFILMLAGCSLLYPAVDLPTDSALPVTGTISEKTITFGNGKLEVLFFDVGQADSILIKSPDDKIMLIDAGERETKEDLRQMLIENGVQKIDVLVGTHPHSDHIGGMQYIVENFEIGAVYMPKVAHNTQTYEKLLKSIQKKGLKITAARAGKIISFGSELTTEIIGPVSDEYEEMNDYSVVIRVNYGQTAFLFTGDAEKPAEEDMIRNTPNQLKATVLKAAHHGSSTGTTEDFLELVDPQFVVISCGTDNKYGHPHDETLELLAEHSITTYRTDELGSILAVSDGQKIAFNKDGMVPEDTSPAKDTVVYRTKSGKAYHKEGCSSLSDNPIKTTVAEAEADGLTPCKKCFK